jgi:GWxTD domain-containing protein
MKTLTAGVVLFLALPVAAADLSKYKDWADSPQAYFLSKAEHEQWATVTTDAQAETFIAEYQAARGKGFTAAIQSRIDAADRTYKTGKTKGARSPVGKTLILLGSPVSTERKSTTAKDKVDVSASDAVNQGGGPGGSGGVNNPTTNVGGPGVNSMRGMAVQEPALIRWIYKGSSAPPGAGASEVTIEFLEDAAGNITFKDPAHAEAVFQKVIEHWAPKHK